MSKNCDTAAQAQKIIARCKELASFTEEPGRITRTFLCETMHNCHRQLAAWLEPLGAEAWIDAAGNFRAFYAAKDWGAPRFLIGSHLDTVPEGGPFDGALGVLIGIALLESLDGKRLPFGIEIAGFSEEEGVRFGVPFIGSRALVGSLDAETLDRQDSCGISVRAAIEQFGLNPRQIPDARIQGEVLGYIEFHIEQGPVLEELDLSLAAVEAIAGQSRLEFTFLGRANHAGSTPMHLRHDAVAAAAEWITGVEHEARRVPDLVATVGSVHAKPGATNVIAREVRLSLDVRHRSDGVRMEAVRRLIQMAEQIATRRQLTVSHRIIVSQPAVAMDPFLVEQIDEAIRRSGCAPHRMTSGAGHDAMILAEKVPSAMIFLRTPGGISHSPEETVKVEDVEKAFAVGLQLLDMLASSGLQTRSTKRA